MFKNDTDEVCNEEDYVRPASKNYKDLEVQVVLSLVLGVSALVVFCVRASPQDAETSS